MKTVKTDSVEEAAEYIKKGGIVAFGTETVYGLGANIFDPAAIEKIFNAKGRPADNPLIAHISSIEQIHELASEITPNAERFLEAFFPGPLTVVLKKTANVPDIATAGLETIGIRMPAFEKARRFIHACGSPLAAPSANRSGKPSPTTWTAVLEDLDGLIDCILKGEPAEIGLESTVVDCTCPVPLLLRPGAVSLEALQRVVKETRLYLARPDEPVRSPGLKHRHYSPAAKVRLVANIETLPERPQRAAYIGFSTRNANEKSGKAGDFELKHYCVDVEEYARDLFEFFRECDRRKIEIIYCQMVPETGIGAALMDRLKRSAEKRTDY